MTQTLVPLTRLAKEVGLHRTTIASYMREKHANIPVLKLGGRAGGTHYVLGSRREAQSLISMLRHDRRAQQAKQVAVGTKNITAGKNRRSLREAVAALQARLQNLETQLGIGPDWPKRETT